MKLFVLIILTIITPIFAHDLAGYLNEYRTNLKINLENNTGFSVRESTEDIVKRELLSVNRFDYNAMHTVVEALDLIAKACVVEGEWDDAIIFLQKAGQISTDNLINTEHTFSKLLIQHRNKIKEWREEISKQKENSYILQSNKDINTDQKKTREEHFQAFLDEYNSAIAHSENSIKDIDNLLVFLKREKEFQIASLANWQLFLKNEQIDIVKVGTAKSYVTERLNKLKIINIDMDESELISYCRRLVFLDPSNIECRHFAEILTGKYKNIKKA